MRGLASEAPQVYAWCAPIFDIRQTNSRDRSHRKFLWLVMRDPIESDLLRTFLVIAETSNFSLAAQRIGRTQSAVSAQIKRLEETIGEPLFERGARGVLLTRPGIQLVPYARRVIDLLSEAAAT